MLTKLTDQNRITLPLSVTEAVGHVEYFEITVESGQIILTPVKIQRSDAVREKLAELKITEQDVADAVTRARKSSLPVGIHGRVGTAHQRREWAIVRCTRFAIASTQAAALGRFQRGLGSVEIK